MKPELRANELTLTPEGWFRLNGGHVRVVMAPDTLTVGCTLVTVEALRALLDKHDELFRRERAVVVQE